MAPSRPLAPPLFIALEVPADLALRLRRLARHLGREEEDLEAVVLLTLRRVCDRLEERHG